MSWTIDYGIEGEPSEEAVAELADAIVDWAEKHKLSVGGGIAEQKEE